MFYATKSVATALFALVAGIAAILLAQVCSGYSLEAMTLRR